MAKRCSHIRADGMRCQGRPEPGKDKCLFHDPEKAAALAEARSKGGKKAQAKQRAIKRDVLPADAPQLPLETVDDVLAVSKANVHYVQTGVVDPKVANAVSQALGVVLKAIEMKRAHRLDDDKKGEAGERPLKAVPVEKLLEMARMKDAEPSNPDAH